MNKFIRYYNQNRREMFIILIIILCIIILLQFINSRIAKKNIKEPYDNTTISTQNISEQYKGTTNTYQIIDGNINTITAEKDIDCIIKFIECCNKKNVEEAYNMLTDECKEVLFPTLEDFKKSYYNNNFKTNKTYNIQSWSNSTYKVDLKENMLYTGKTNENNIQDFITVIQNQDECRLNINTFIKKEDLNKSNYIKNINVEVISSCTFMTYEKYKLKIKNDNDFELLLDDLQKTDTIYVTDENNIKYPSYSHEISKEQLRILPHSSIEIEIKFTNGYIVGREIQKITFSNIIIRNEEQEITQLTIVLK